MKRYLIRSALTGYPVTSTLYATQAGAEKAAKRISAGLPHGIDVVWCNDAGVPKVTVAYAYRGVVERTAESPVS